MKIKSLGLKISLIVTVIIAVVIILIVLIISARTDQLVNNFTKQSAAFANVSLEINLDEYVSEARSLAGAMGSSEPIADAIINNDIETLRQLVGAFKEGVDMITITDAAGTVIMRSYSDVAGDSIANENSIARTLSTGQQVGFIEIDSNDLLTTAGTAAIRDGEGNTIGVVRCGHDLTDPRYVDRIKETSNCEVTIFAGNVRVNTTILNEQRQRAVGTKASDVVTARVLNQGETFQDRLEIFGSTYAVSYSPLMSDGNRIGILFAGVKLDDILADQQAKVAEVITVGVITGFVGIALVFVLSIFMISKPLKKIGQFADKIKVGELGISSFSESIIAVRANDEVGVLARSLEQAYNQLKTYIAEIQERMSGLAQGDLVTHSLIDFEGDFILIKDSINDIVINLNQIMSSINTASLQVASGSKQIADGATALAQGSTEQAASVEELSSSIAEIAKQTVENADMASRAAELASIIKGNAEKGSVQMDEMITAVKEINAASKSISKVIKVIDDIAFQTNILALNAAVEAARAGQHGKGFAVVAQEVRSLAAKSAEAAKDTGGLIANSMEKAELGSRIAGETAESLTEIVAGINESDELVSEISQSSKEQSESIAKINIGIDQVAQVIQQNSATAQQSAAASEQMSSQSSMLEEMIGQFKLEDATKRLGLEMPKHKADSEEVVPEFDGGSDFNIGIGGDFGKY